MGSFLVTGQEVENFSRHVHVDNQEGILLTYEAPEKVIKRITPPHFELLDPTVNAYICQIKNPSFGGPFMESCIWFRVKYKENTGNYFLSLLLHGPGEECGKIIGRDCCGLPKKTTDRIEIRRMGSTAWASVVRHGVTLMEVKADLDGAYNEKEAALRIGDHRAGDTFNSTNLFHKVDLNPVKDGVEFRNARLMYTEYRNTCQSFEKGKLEIRMASSPDDPYGELEVVRPLGAAWYKYGDCIRIDAGLLAEVDTQKTMPYLMTGLYDRSMMGDGGTCLAI